MPETTLAQDSMMGVLLQVVGAGSDDVPVAIVHAPLTVRPSRFPRASFEKAKRAATVFNSLIDRVSRDSDYLQKTLALAAEHDDFTVRSPLPFYSMPM